MSWWSKRRERVEAERLAREQRNDEIFHEGAVEMAVELGVPLAQIDDFVDAWSRFPVPIQHGNAKFLPELVMDTLLVARAHGAVGVR